MNRFCKAVLALVAATALAACGGSDADAGISVFDSSASSPTGGSGGSTTPGGGISTVSNGVASQRFMSISVEKYNLNWAIDGDTTTVQVYVADTAGNPVPNGSVVQFSTEGGQIVTSCQTTGTQNGTAVISGCNVTFNTQDFRPIDGFARIIAWMVGEEAYKDMNANGQYDTGEPFVDTGRIFRDDDDSGNYSATFDELSIGATLSGAPGIGASACAPPTEPVNINEVPLSVDNTCDGVWGTTLIRRTVVLPISDPRDLRIEGSGGGVIVYTAGGAYPSPFRKAAPAGTTVTASNPPAGCTVTVSPTEVSVVSVYETVHRIEGKGSTTDPSACSGKTVLVEAKFQNYGTASVIYTFP